MIMQQFNLYIKHNIYIDFKRVTPEAIFIPG